MDRPLASARLVVIAASAGGLGAISRVLAALPLDFPAPIAIVQHRGLQHPQLLPELLARMTRLPVRHARDGEPLAPGVIYVCPPGMHMMSEHCVRLVESPRFNGVRPNADLMLRSAARAYGERAVAVVLSGHGQDGSLGCLAIRQAGGAVIVQEASTCGATGMPAAAARLTATELVLPPEQIAAALEQLMAGDHPRPRRERIKVLLVDDHPILRHGLRTLLQTEDDIEVIAEAEDGCAAVRLAIELTPDVVVMDIGMPGIDGVEATQQIVEFDPKVRIVALSAHSDAATLAAILAAGALVCLSKQSAFNELTHAIRRAMADRPERGPSADASLPRNRP